MNDIQKNLGNFVNPNFYYTRLLILGMSEGKLNGKRRCIPDDF